MPITLMSENITVYLSSFCQTEARNSPLMSGVTCVKCLKLMLSYSLHITQKLMIR